MARVVLFLGVLLLASPLARAADDNWTAGAGDWFGGTNWSLNAAPTTGDNAIIDNGGIAQVQAPGAAANIAFIGGANSGSLEVSGGGTLNDTVAAVGFLAGSTGEVRVSGTGSTWTNNALLLGIFGTGTLTIANGGTADVLGGAGTHILAAGDGSSGTINIEGAVGGILNTLDVFGGNGTATLNFNHTDADYFFTRDGTAGGAAVTITGSTAVNHLGTGTTVLSGVNTYTGGTAMTAGILSVANDGNLGEATGVLSFDGGTLQATAGFTMDRDTTLNAGGGTFDVTGGTLIQQGDFGGTGGLTKTGAGQLTLTGVNTYTGGTTVEAGTLQSGSASAFVNNQSYTINGGTLDLNDFDLTMSALTGTGGTVDLGSAALTIDQTNDTSFAGVIAGAGDLTKTGAGTLTLTGSNTHTGGTTVSAGALAVEGGSISHAGADLLVGGQTGDNSALAITNGGAVSNRNGFIGNNAGGTDTVTVDGAGTTWSNGDVLAVGNAGTGTLNIQNGGAVSNDAVALIGNDSGSTGTVTVDGVGSTWSNNDVLVVGNAGTGALTITNGGSVSNDAVGVIGFDPGSTGTVTVDGAGSTWSNGDVLAVGNAGDGTLTITNGGTVSSDSVAVISSSNGSTGIATVDGTGSIWSTSGALAVGNAGTGTLNIQNGGAVRSDAVAVIGNETGSSGAVTVSGAGSAWSTADDIFVGFSGDGALAITDGGVINVNTGTGTLTLADNGGSSGTLNVGDGGAAGILNAASVNGGSGAATLNFNHTDADYFFTQDGTAGGAAIAITGSTAVNHLGTGTTILTGANTHTGGTTVNAGTLAVAGGSISHAGSDIVLGGQAGDNGALGISNGGAVSSQNGVIGSSAGSTGAVTVDGAGSTWTNASSVHVGNIGAGTLNITSGGAVSNDFGFIGSQPGSTGATSVDGAGSTWTSSSDLEVGNLGNGSLTLSNGGRVNVAGAFTLGSTVGSSGTLNIGDSTGAGILNTATVNGGSGAATLNFNHTDAEYFFTQDGTAGGAAIAIAGSTAVNHLGTGTTILTGANTHTGGTTVNAGTLRVEGSLTADTAIKSGATLGGSGTIGGTVTVDDGGILAPGSSAGTLTLNSLILNSTSVLEFELGTPGVAGSEVNDLIEVTGDVTLDGLLNVTDIGGFGPGSYRLINFGGTLTDNGLDLGTLPAGVNAGDLAVQTSVASQVNLFFAAPPLPAPLPLIPSPPAPPPPMLQEPTRNVWGGNNPGLRGDGTVVGGDGVWTASSTNWTSLDGSAKGPLNDSFAIFQGQAGTVTVDTGAGPIGVTGMQFATDGYRLQGDALVLEAAETLLRVGDGTQAGMNFSATVSSSLTGAGGMVKTDLGTLILTGNNTYTGATTINDGILQIGNGGTTGSIAGDVTNNASLVFNRSDAQTFGGVIAGTGELTKQGAGTLTLSGANTYSGATTIGNGTLIVNGSIANSTAAVNRDGTLGGTGTVGTTTVNAGGTLSPGNSPGVLTVAGDLTLMPGSVTVMEINGRTPGTEHDQINVTGVAGLDGTLDLDFGFVPVDGDRFNLINAGDMVLAGDPATGFTAITDNLGAALLATPVIDPRTFDILIALSQQRFVTAAGVPLTFNQGQVAANLDTFATSGQAADLIGALNLLSAEALPGAFNSLSGVQHTHGQTLAFQASREFRRSLFGCLADTPGTLEAADLTRTTDPGRTRGCGLWVKAFGGFGDIDGDGNASGAEYHGGGTAIGSDVELRDDLVVGAAFSYTRTDIDPTAGSLELNSFQGALYGGWQRDAWYAHASAGFGYHDFDTRRHLAVDGLSDTAKADYGGWTITGGAEAGRHFATRVVTFTPFAGLEHTHLRRDDFDEAGAGEANLEVDAEHEDSLRTALGVRLHGTVITAGGLEITPAVEFAWLREALDDDARLSAAFDGTAGGDFRIKGPDLDRTRARVAAGITAQLAETAYLHLGYTGEITGSDDHHAFGAAFRMMW